VSNFKGDGIMADDSKYITQHQWARIIAEAWLDDKFREALEKDPGAAIKQRFNFKFEYVLKVPPRPADLSDEHIDEIKRSDDAVHFRCSAIDRCSLFTEEAAPRRCSFVRRCSEEEPAPRRCSREAPPRCSEETAPRCSQEEPTPRRCSREAGSSSSEEAAPRCSADAAPESKQ
jgi:hypothetical protein